MAALQIQNQAAENQVKLSHNYETDVKDEDSQIDKSCIVLAANKLKYYGGEWVFSSENCVEDVAELIRGQEFEVKGIFHTEMLSPNTFYAVTFGIKMRKHASGWDVPVIMKLILPNGITEVHPENLKEKPAEKWLDIPVGTFFTSHMVGKAEACMCAEDPNWKKGLVFRNVKIRPIREKQAGG